MKKHTTAERLNQIMRERGLKQVDILLLAQPYCQKYGVKLNRNDLSQYVNGKVEPGQQKLTLLGLALNVSEAWLMGYDVPMSRDPDDKKSAPAEDGESQKIKEIIEKISQLSDSDLIQLDNFVSFLVAQSKAKAEE